MRPTDERNLVSLSSHTDRFCADCGEPADWHHMPSGQDLCQDCWDEYVRSEKDGEDD